MGAGFPLGLRVDMSTRYGTLMVALPFLTMSGDLNAGSSPCYEALGKVSQHAPCHRPQLESVPYASRKKSGGFSLGMETMIGFPDERRLGTICPP
jgi:hypothetical protein